MARLAAAVPLLLLAACAPESLEPFDATESISAAATALTVPPRVTQLGKENTPLVLAGYLDVTLYDGWNGHRVDPTGQADSTAGIQQAMNDANTYSFATYLPPGTYLISNTLLGTEAFDFTPIGTPFHQLQAPSLVGPSSGPRPVLRLADHASGFGSATAPKPLVHFVDLDQGCTTYGGPGCDNWPGQDDALYQATLRDVNLELGTGNAGAIGLQMAAAQSTYVENVSVDATGAYAGFQGGTTEVMVNLSVTGGSYGFIVTQRPAITVVGLTLQNQTVAGLTYDSAAVMLAGFDIQEGAIPAIVNVGYTDQGITLDLVDGTLSVTGTQPAIVDPFGDDMHIANVYVKAAGPLLQIGKGLITGSGGQDCITEYSHTDAVPLTRNGVTDTSYTLLGGVRGQSDVFTLERAVSAPPGDLVLRHLPGPLPWFQDPGTVDVTSLGAVPDGVTDDTAAIQRAINSGRDVFLPRGDYVISGTLLLQSNTRLFGVPGMRSQLHAPKWDPKGQFQPFIRTANTATGATYLGDVWIDLPDNVGGIDQTYLSGLDWQAGRSSIVRQVYVMVDWDGSNVTSAARKLVHLEGEGGGRWYGLQLAQTHSRMGNPLFRALFVDRTTEPATFYGVNPEHELYVPFVEINGASNVRILGFKEEGAATLVSQSSNVMVAAHTGDTDPEVQILNSQNVTVSDFGAYDTFGSSTSSVISVVNNGVTTSIPANDRVSLFKEGQFDATAFPHCGDGVCDGAETPSTCPRDCGKGAPDAGSGTTDAGSSQPDAGTTPAHHFSVALAVTDVTTGAFTLAMSNGATSTSRIASIDVATDASLTWRGDFACATSSSGVTVSGPPCSGGILSPYLLATFSAGLASGATASVSGTLYYPSRLTSGLATVTFEDKSVVTCTLANAGETWACHE